jgi:hypothetical protein
MRRIPAKSAIATLLKSRVIAGLSATCDAVVLGGETVRQSYKLYLI